MRYLMRAIASALFLFIAASQTAVLSLAADGGCVPVLRITEYLGYRHFDYVIVSGPAVQAWLDVLDDKSVMASQVIVASNPKAGVGMAMFAAEGVVCKMATFQLDEAPVKLHRS